MLNLSGIVPPVVTSLLNGDQLDTTSVDRIAEHLIAGGVSGLFALGTTGEGPSLTYQIRYEMTERICDAAASRVPVLVGVTDSSLHESIHLAEHAAACGATAIVAAAPFYFPIDQDSIIAWFRQLADASPIPLLLYNMPSCVRVSLTTQTVVTLSTHENIAGVKDSSGDMNSFNQLCDRFRDADFLVFMGPEELVPEAVAAGADGAVTGGGNLLPDLYVRLFAASQANDSEEVCRLRDVVQQVYRQIYKDPHGDMQYLPALKTAMAVCGLCDELAAPPLQPVSADHRQQIVDALPALLHSAGSPLEVAGVE